MGSGSIAHEGERNNCFSKIQLVDPKNIETKHLSLVKAIVLVFKAGALWCFSIFVKYYFQDPFKLTVILSMITQMNAVTVLLWYKAFTQGTLKHVLLEHYS